MLRTGGQFHFLEHGLCPEPGTRAGSTASTVSNSGLQPDATLTGRSKGWCAMQGFEIQELRNDWFKGPRPSKPWGYLYEGAAIKP